jgi:hypothetical protein
MLDDDDESWKREVFVDGKWQEFDGHGENTKESREFYHYLEEFASGSLPLRYNGHQQKDSTPDSIFYRKKH